MKKLILPAIASLAILAGCQQQFAKGCANAADWYAVYEAAKGEGAFSAKAAANVEKAYAHVTDLCADPQNATVLSMTPAVTRLVLAVKAGLKEKGKGFGYSANVRQLERALSKAESQLK